MEDRRNANQLGKFYYISLDKENGKAKGLLILKKNF